MDFPIEKNYVAEYILLKTKKKQKDYVKNVSFKYNFICFYNSYMYNLCIHF